MAEQEKFTFWEWAVIFGLMALAIAISQFIGLSRNWEDAVVYTVILFTVVTLALRSAWGYVGFWQNLTKVFALHHWQSSFSSRRYHAGREGLTVFGWLSLVWLRVC